MSLLEDPRIPPQVGDTGSWVRQFSLWFGGHYRRLVQQLNWLGEGRIQAATSATTAAPTGGTWAAGDFVRNTAPAEAGSGGSKYVITGWVCTVAGTPGTWVECRALTGN